MNRKIGIIAVVLVLVLCVAAISLGAVWAVKNIPGVARLVRGDPPAPTALATFRPTFTLPPPSTLTRMSYFASDCVTSSGRTISTRKVSRGKYCSIGRLLTEILPDPGFTTTRATEVLRRPTAMVGCELIRNVNSWLVKQ